MTGTLRRAGAVVGASLLLGAAAQAPPPGPPEPIPEPRYAIALEPGSLRRQPDVASGAVQTFEAGAVFLHLGETRDAFGRDWQIIGDPAAWQLQQQWVAVPEGIRLAGPVETIAVLTGLPAPTPAPADGGASSERPQPVPVTDRWWERVAEAPIEQLRGDGARLGLTAFTAPREVVDEAIELLGGIDALGPMPERPAPGRLHVPELLPLALYFDGAAWRPVEPGRLLEPGIGVLGNARLRIDPVAPPEASGPIVSCWNLVGGINARGAVVGRLAVAPPPASPPAPAVRPPEARLLGAFDLRPRVGPFADAALVAPRRLAPPAVTTGVQIDDASRRQAVYLEQRLSGAPVERLRGRTVRLAVAVRAAPEAEGTVSTASPAIEIIAGSVRETVSGAVGAVSEPLVLTVEVPVDAQEIVVRLLPVDRSIAVQEAGRAIFDAAYLGPAEWPERLARTALVVRRERISMYAPARRYTRAAVAVSTRAPAVLRAAWEATAELELGDEARAATLAGTLEAGMSTAAVRLAWDEPERIEEGSLVRWKWQDRSAAFEGDELVMWHRLAEPPRPRLPRCPGARPRR